jgi:hypothetical protein
MHGTPGQVLHGTVSVRNLSRSRMTVILQRADIENASNGNADYVTTGLYRTGRWLRLSAGTVHLAPQAAQLVAFTVRIPARASGASHYAGIVAVNAADLSHAAARATATGRAFTFYRITRRAVPVTVHLPGRLWRNLTLRSVKIAVQPVGAGLVLGLRPNGTELTEGAQVNLRVLRGARKIFTYVSALGQLFPGGRGLDYRIGWPGRPTAGTYRVVGQIRPQGSAVINIDQTIVFTPQGAAQLQRTAGAVATPPTSGTPGWVWVVLAVACGLVIALSLAVWKLVRRPRNALAS